MPLNRVNASQPIFLIVASVLAMLVVITSADADTPTYLNEMPSVARIMNTVHGKNAVDTAARQWGAFDRLISMMGLMRPQEFVPLTSDERRLRRSYITAENKIVASVRPMLSKQKASETGTNTSWEKWNKLRYEYSEGDTSYILNQFFSPKWQREYHVAAQHEKQLSKIVSQNQNPKNQYALNKYITKYRNIFIYASLLLVIVVVRIFAPKYRKLLSLYGLLYFIEAFVAWFLLATLPLTLLSWFVNIILGIFVTFGSIFVAGLLMKDVRRRKYAILASYDNDSSNYDISNDVSDDQSSHLADQSYQRAKCSSCGGTGNQSCPSSMCRGGYQYMGGESSFSELCPTCLGKGEITCSRCGGSGYS